ncbi:hypothetical protein D3C81_1416620 [compost metagenome]
MKWLLALLVVLSVSAHASDESKFVMSEPHCKVLKQHALLAIAGKSAGVSYPQYVRERVEGYARLTAMERVLYLDILPYSLEMAYEYFNGDFNANTPYEEVIYVNCLKGAGRVAE